MNWLRVSGFILFSVFMVSCSNNDSKVEDLELKLDEAIALADSIKIEYKLLGEMFEMQELDIFSLRDSVFSLTRNNIFLKVENNRLRLGLLASREHSVQKKSKKEKSDVVVSIATGDTIKKEPASIFETPVVVDSTLTVIVPSSFIDFMWEKRNRVEP
ncbi:MAG: hypothetical protein Q8Q92_03700 [bacterium]|nr:hypothetical protein [bacterium]